jgi:hypothetical protein
MKREDVPEIEAGQCWEIDLFRPEDGEGVAGLFLTVYGEGYPIRTYLDPDRLREENASGRTISSVARTPRGDVVAHNALFRSAPFEGIYETGAGLVHPLYRGGKGLFTGVIAHGLTKAAPAFGLSGVYGESVCNHVFSQKACRSLGMTTHALEVDLMPAEAYVKEMAATGRVASLIEFISVKPRPQEVFIPAPYKDAFRFLYEGLGEERSLREAGAPLPSGRSSEVSGRYFDFAGVARIAVRSAGEDLPARMEAEESEMAAKGARILQAWLNLGEPWVGEAAGLLRSRGYFLGGLLPRWFDTDGMLMQKMDHRPHWEEIQLEFDRAKRITAAVRTDWEASSAA